jgi:hypothetical protein
MRELARSLKLRRLLDRATPVLDLAWLPATAAAGVHMRMLRETGLEKLGRSRALLNRIGVFPLEDHYYEPLFDTESLRGKLDDHPRDLPGQDLRVPDQLALLGALRFGDELRDLPRTGAGPGRFAYDNGNFGPGDAELLYSLLRHRKPKRVLEVGSGFSTLVARAALDRNASEGAPCRHQCIEPYEMPWLESTGATVVRRRVEDVDRSLFQELEAGDVLFIDTSHVIRPLGDVLTLHQQIVPSIPAGVLVHVHDVFTPYDYPERWLVDRICFWNEQYVLESFLQFNPQFRVVLAANLCWRQHREELLAACPVLAEDGSNQPKSFWFERV